MISVGLCRLKAAGISLNLQTDNHMIDADPWWNPAIDPQSLDHVYHIKHDKHVCVHCAIIEGTIEERIEAALEKKWKIADDIIKASGQGLKGWTQ